jgi:DNA-binding NtrC family response regulator
MILIVDDQKNMCWILSKVLTDAGFAVVTAETAAEALAIAAHGEVRAAIIDYRLPDQNGLTLFAALQQYHPQLLGVLITSYGSGQLREEALRRGFHAYVDKPVDNRTLVAALQALLKRPRTSTELP